MDWKHAPDIKESVEKLVENLNLNYLNTRRIFCFRSYGSKSRARARIWSLPKIWQMAFDCPAGYCIEIISEKYDHLSAKDKNRILIHELMHIPKNFSGALVPHLKRNMKMVDILFKELYDSDN